MIAGVNGMVWLVAGIRSGETSWACDDSRSATRDRGAGEALEEIGSGSGVRRSVESDVQQDVCVE